MSRISAQLSGMERTLLNRLTEDQAAIAMSVLRKSTGKNINHAADDPSAFVMLSQLQSQLTAASKAATNATAAAKLVAFAETETASIGRQLQTIRTALLDESLTPEQAQAVVDEALASIDRSASASIGGRNWLGGGAQYDVANVNRSQVAEIQVAAASSGRQVHAVVTQTAQQARLAYQGDNDNKVTADAQFILSGRRGEITVSATAGQTLQSLADAVNQQSYRTGVTASVNAADHTLTFTSVDYGSRASARIEVLSGSFVVSGGDGHGFAQGDDARAVINNAQYRGDGNRFDIDQNGLRLSIEFAAGFTGGTSTMVVSGEPLRFALDPNLGSSALLALPDLHTARLGGPSGSLDQLGSGGPLSVASGNRAQAIRVVDEAAAKVGLASAKLGGFAQATVNTAVNYLNELTTTLSDAIDQMDEVNVPREDALIAHYQALASNTLAGLTILNQQRMQVVDLIRRIAGI